MQPWQVRAPEPLKAALCMHCLLFHPAKAPSGVFRAKAHGFALAAAAARPPGPYRYVQGGQHTPSIALRQLADRPPLSQHADTNWDYGGSCGRCYEVRCKSGLVLDKGAPVKTTQFFDMGKANPNFIDGNGRKWPGGCQFGCRLGFIEHYCAAPMFRVSGLATGDEALRKAQPTVFPSTATAARRWGNAHSPWDVCVSVSVWHKQQYVQATRRSQGTSRTCSAGTTRAASLCAWETAAPASRRSQTAPCSPSFGAAVVQTTWTSHTGELCCTQQNAGGGVCVQRVRVQLLQRLAAAVATGCSAHLPAQPQWGIRS